jgi:hypothetical protein
MVESASRRLRWCSETGEGIEQRVASSPSPSPQQKYGNVYYFVASNWVLHFSLVAYFIIDLAKFYLPIIAPFLGCSCFNWKMTHYQVLFVYPT